MPEINREKCNGCGVCFGLCNMDVLRLNTEQEEKPPCQAACPSMNETPFPLVDCRLMP